MTMKVRPPLRANAPNLPGEVIYHRAGRDVDALTWAQPTMKVANYANLYGRGNNTFFDAKPWGEMRYEGSAFQVVDRHGFQKLSGICAWRRRWNH